MSEPALARKSYEQAVKNDPHSIEAAVHAWLSSSAAMNFTDDRGLTTS